MHRIKTRLKSVSNDGSQPVIRRVKWSPPGRHKDPESSPLQQDILRVAVGPSPDKQLRLGRLEVQPVEGSIGEVAAVEGIAVEERDIDTPLNPRLPAARTHLEDGEPVDRPDLLAFTAEQHHSEIGKLKEPASELQKSENMEVSHQTTHSDPKGKSNGYVKTHVYNCMLYLYDTKTRSYLLDMK